jgi:phosphoribosyl 1,2-cyclic phosphodiesterase
MLRPMRCCVLASGSRANAIYLESGPTRVLFDCGLSLRQLEQRMLGQGLKASDLTAVVVTHEHSDHVRGVPTLSRKHRIPVYSNAPTAEFLAEVEPLECFVTGTTFTVGSLTLRSFPTSHDASEPVGFIVEDGNIRFALVTDLGEVTDSIRSVVRGADAAVVEFNHDSDRLWGGPYPWVLKQRIASKFGHLNNRVAAELVSDLTTHGLKHVFLAHLSEENNTPSLAMEALREHVSAERLARAYCTSALQASPVYDLTMIPQQSEVAA